MFNELLNKLQTDSYLTLETTPTHEPTLEKIVSEIEKYDLANKVDGFSTTDNPLAKLKYNALFAALKLQTQFKKLIRFFMNNIIVIHTCCTQKLF